MDILSSLENIFMRSSSFPWHPTLLVTFINVLQQTGGGVLRRLSSLFFQKILISFLQESGIREGVKKKNLLKAKKKSHKRIT